jgi:hypothetical protein
MITHGQEAWNMVKRMLNVESKAIEQFETSALGNVSTTPLFTDLTAGIAQGDSDYTRDGDSLKINRLSVDYTVFSVSDVVRVLITQSTDEAIAAADLLANVGSVYTVLSPKAWDTRSQFRVLYDRCHNLNGSNGSTSELQTHHFETKKEMHVQYFNGTTTVEKGAIQLWFVTLQASTGHYVASQIEYVDN